MIPTQISNPEPPEWREIADGVCTFTLQNWRAFHDLVLQEAMLSANLIWRGQRRDWMLKPSLERSRVEDDPNQWRRIAAEQLYEFKIAVAGRRGANPRNLDGEEGTPEEDDEWWALGQQNGLKTPLLDWTESPFAALFFAFIDEDILAEFENENEHFRYVYALDQSILFFKGMELKDAKARAWEENPEPEPQWTTGSVRSAAIKKIAWEARRDERLRVPWIRVVRPHTDENVRLLSQGGLFTQSPPARDIEGFIREHFKVETGNPPMLRFKIGSEYRGQCLTALKRMAIHYRTLFPDLHGACQHVNMTLDTY